jgi:hypothetical protein
VAGRSQPFSSAGQTSALRSADQPGNCSKPTATQRLPPGLGTAGAAVGGGAGAAGGAGGCGAVPQPARAPRIAAATHAVPTNTRRGLPMLLLLLEALAALCLLVFIVWWVMFSGRRKGERDDGEPR